MNYPLTAIHKPKVGTCPHGLPPGACPICSGMGGGGGGSARKADRPAGEMSWAECVAMGQILKAQRLAQQQRDQAILSQAQSPTSFTSKLESMAQKIANLSERLADFAQKAKEMPRIIAKPLEILAKLAVPVLNVLKNVPIIAQKALNFVQQKFADISDKLNAVFGELKNSIEKKISESLKNFKKKFKSIFSIEEPADIDDEEKKVEDDKRLLEMKTVFESIKEKLKKKVKDADSQSN